MKGKLNVVDYALFRNPTLTLMKFHDDWKLQLALEYSKNQFACDLFDGLIHHDTYKILSNIIYHKDIIYLVP